jgi:GntR family transcriptional repressor for pyruvate dehydrogenase complex
MSASMSSSVSEEASRAMRDLLLRGRFQPGDRLPPERDLADGLRLSRPTVREAIRRLTEAGMVESRRGSGTFVADVDFDAVFAVRLQLEPFAASLAAVHRSPAHLSLLTAGIQTLEAVLDSPEEFAAADLDLHRTIAAACANPVLEDLLERLSSLTQLSRGVTSTSERVRAVTLRQWRTLVRAVRNGNASAASSAMEIHLTTVREASARMRPTNREITRPA